jgi:hypothetical protein
MAADRYHFLPSWRHVAAPALVVRKEKSAIGGVRNPVITHSSVFRERDNRTQGQSEGADLRGRVHVREPEQEELIELLGAWED